MNMVYRLGIGIMLIVLFNQRVNAQVEVDKEALHAECEQVSDIFAELDYFQLELQEIRKRKSKGFYSKDDYPYEMLDLSFRKYVKKNITKLDFNFFTQTMKAVDNYLAAIENRFNKQLVNEKTGLDNKAEQQRFQDAKTGAEQAFVKEKAKFDIDCSRADKTSNTKKKKKKK